MTEFAIYDMDRTITRSGTFTPWLLFFAVRRAPWRLLLLPVAALGGVAYALRLITRRQIKELNQWLLVGPSVERDQVQPLVEAFAAHTLARNSHAAALAQIAADRAAGRRILLATASHHYYVDVIARLLGVSDVIATGSVWRGSRLTWRIPGENCYGPAKLRMIEAWFAANGIDRSTARVRFYSDHASDMPVFDWADDPFPVNASWELRREAAAHGWTLTDWSTPPA